MTNQPATIEISALDHLIWSSKHYLLAHLLSPMGNDDQNLFKYMIMNCINAIRSNKNSAQADRALTALGIWHLVKNSKTSNTLLRAEVVAAWREDSFAHRLMDSLLRNRFDVTVPPSTPDDLRKHITRKSWFSEQKSQITVKDYLAICADDAIMEAILARFDAKAWGTLFHKTNEINAAAFKCISESTAQRPNAAPALEAFTDLSLVCAFNNGRYRGLRTLPIAERYTDAFLAELLTGIQNGTFAYVSPRRR